MNDSLHEVFGVTEDELVSFCEKYVEQLESHKSERMIWTWIQAEHQKMIPFVTMLFMRDMYWTTLPWYERINRWIAGKVLTVLEKLGLIEVQ